MFLTITRWNKNLDGQQIEYLQEEKSTYMVYFFTVIEKKNEGTYYIETLENTSCEDRNWLKDK